VDPCVVHLVFATYDFIIAVFDFVLPIDDVVLTTSDFVFRIVDLSLVFLHRLFFVRGRAAINDSS